MADHRKKRKSKVDLSKRRSNFGLVERNSKAVEAHMRKSSRRSELLGGIALSYKSALGLNITHTFVYEINLGPHSS